MLTSAGMPSSAASSTISRMTASEVLGSRLEVGSSTRRIRGRCTSARAMPTRCRCPPESASARLFSKPVEPDARERAVGGLDVVRRKAAAPRLPERDGAEPARQHVLHHREALDQVELLEDHRHAPAGGRSGAAGQRGDLHVVEAHGAAVGLDQPVDAAQQGGLAGAGGADDEDGVVALHGEGHTPQRPVAGRVGLGERRRREQALVARGFCRRLYSSESFVNSRRWP